MEGSPHYAGPGFYWAKASEESDWAVWECVDTENVLRGIVMPGSRSWYEMRCDYAQERPPIVGPRLTPPEG